MSHPQKEEQQSEKETLFEENLAEVLEARSDRYTAANAAILDAFDHAFMRCDGQEQHQFLDVGCGVGDLTFNHLLPRCLPCRRLVAVDRFENLIEAAGRTYPHPNIEYLPLDIVGDVDEFVRAQGQFQRVYSFSMLHWVKDHHLAMQNFEKLLAPGGELFITILAGSLFHDMKDAFMKFPWWAKYNEMLDEKTPGITGPKDIQSLRKYARNLLKYTNLIPMACEVFSYPAPKRTKDQMINDFMFFEPVTPSLNEEKEKLREFVADFTDQIWRAANEGKIVDRKMIIIHAEKPPK